MSSSVYAMLKLSKTTSPQTLFRSDCINLYLWGVEGLGGPDVEGLGRRPREEGFDSISPSSPETKEISLIMEGGGAA